MTHYFFMQLKCSNANANGNANANSANANGNDNDCNENAAINIKQTIVGLTVLVSVHFNDSVSARRRSGSAVTYSQ